jgi:hypothetical protein
MAVVGGNAGERFEVEASNYTGEDDSAQMDNIYLSEGMRLL